MSVQPAHDAIGPCAINSATVPTVTLTTGRAAGPLPSLLATVRLSFFSLLLATVRDSLTALLLASAATGASIDIEVTLTRNH